MFLFTILCFCGWSISHSIVKDIANISGVYNF